MTFFDPLYRALAYIGYSDPLHPPFTHYPIALITASLFFGLVALFWRRPGFCVTAKHCLVLAWLFIFPTVLFGFMDWQYYYHGIWMGPIIVKIILASLLFVLLSIGLLLVYKGRSDSRAILVIYALGFLTVVGLGYFGGKIVYEGIGKGGLAAGVSPQIKAGEGVFGKNCLSCHPNGGNVIMPQAPIIGSPRLADFPRFLAWIRAPRLPDGKPAAMPGFPPAKISDKEARELYQYLVLTFGKPSPPKAHR
jgi:uncharacterized membrane protein